MSLNVHFFSSAVKNKNQHRSRQFKTQTARGFKDEVSKCYFQFQNGAHTHKNSGKPNRKPGGEDESLYFRHNFCKQRRGCCLVKGHSVSFCSVFLPLNGGLFCFILVFFFNIVKLCNKNCNIHEAIAIQKHLYVYICDRLILNKKLQKPDRRLLVGFKAFTQNLEKPLTLEGHLSYRNNLTFSGIYPYLLALQMTFILVTEKLNT